MAILITTKTLNAALEALRKEMTDGFVSITKEFAEEELIKANKIKELEGLTDSLELELKKSNSIIENLGSRLDRALNILSRKHKINYLNRKYIGR